MGSSRRCKWSESHELFIPYHDKEWGTPCKNDRKLYEMLCLEGAQAGLSWLTILKKRPHYREVFENFDFKKVAKFNTRKKSSLLKDPGIVRHPQKIEAFIENAQAVIDIRSEHGTFARYIWNYVDFKPIQSGKQNSKSVLSALISKDLKKKGFRFVGPTTVYSFMQAAGMINDHEKSCFRHRELKSSEVFK